MYASMKVILDKMSNLSEGDFKAVRKTIGISQAEFASLLDVDIKTVSRIERGHCRINARMAFSVHLLKRVYQHIHTEKQVYEFEKKERERESLASRERRQESANRQADPRLTHGSGKRKKKKKR